MNVLRNEFSQIREYVEGTCGVVIAPSKDYLIESRLAQMVVQYGCRDVNEFYREAVKDRTGVILDRIVDAMTTKETMWFRDADVWQLFRTVIIPELESRTEGMKAPMKVWSAACSTGQEPYSMAMLLEEMQAIREIRSAANYQITATDISSTSIDLANEGRYNRIVMARGLPSDYREKYFTEENGASLLSQRIRDRVSFRKLNLLRDMDTLGSFDVILIRNVLMYFSKEIKQALLHRIATSLRPGGVLIVGASESLLEYTSEFRLVKSERAVYYQLNR